MKDQTAYVSSIQKFTVHDGVGIRTTVFLLGCPLSCKWCQNPEAIAKEPQIMMNYELCTMCGACIAACPEEAIFEDAGRINTDENKCEKCFECTKECYFKARVTTGSMSSVDELIEELVKDEEFFKTSGGGVTLSGGEPMRNAAFCEELFLKLKYKGIHTAIETCGHAKWDRFERIVHLTDLFLYDIKFIDAQKHRKWTGADNELILRNARKLAKLGKNIIVRIPLIPGINDDDEEFGSIVKFAKSLEGVQEIHILPFHQVGSSKYEAIGREYELADLNEENGERVQSCKELAQAAGFRVSVGGSGFRSSNENTNFTAKYKGFIYNI